MFLAVLWLYLLKHSSRFYFCLFTSSFTYSMFFALALFTLLSGGNSTIESWKSFESRVKSVAQVRINCEYYAKDRQGKAIPILRVESTSNKDLEKACALIMAVLDPHRDKMTFNIDVPHTDHSYIIGKDGSRIKLLSNETKCHIHLPDCNKTDQAAKSNKLSIAGTSFEAIEKARSQIRKSLPLNIRFKAKVENSKFMLIDTSTSEVQAIKRRYHVDVTFTDVNSFQKYTEVTINVKGGRSQSGDIKNAAQELYQFVTGEDMYANRKLVFSISIDISHAHHQFVKGKGNCNMNCIKSRNNSNIIFPDSPNVNKVIVENTDIGSTVFGWQELMGYLPLLLSFDVNFDITKYKDEVDRIEKEESVGIRLREKLCGHVYTVLVKTQERNSLRLKEIRQQILDINPNSSSAVSPPVSRTGCKRDRFNLFAKPFTPCKASASFIHHNASHSYSNYYTSIINNNNNNFSTSNLNTTYNPDLTFSSKGMTLDYDSGIGPSPPRSDHCTTYDYSFDSRFLGSNTSSAPLSNLTNNYKWLT